MTAEAITPDEVTGPKSILVIVPPGTRVRYMENPHIPKPVMIDADRIPTVDNPVTVPLLGSLGPPFGVYATPPWGVPLYDAERHEGGPL